MTTDSALDTTPGVIPYVEFHTGPRRLLTIDLTTGNSRVLAKYRPVASIDGRQYIVVWGPVSWEIPADRNVHVSVHLEGDYLAQAASVILPPGDGRKVLHYATDYMSGIGTLSDPPQQAPAN
jgi:hypothetical protein